MRKTKWIFLCFLCGWTISASAQEKLLGVLRDELSKQMEQLKGKELPPYYMDYRATDQRTFSVITSFGVLVNDDVAHSCSFVPQVRLGSAGLDNFKLTDHGGRFTMTGPTYGTLPIGEVWSEAAVRQGIWQETAERYQLATDVWKKMDGIDKITVKQEDNSPCFSAAPVVKYYEEPLESEKVRVDLEDWTKKLKEISAVFKAYPDVLKGEAGLSFKVVRTYFVNTEGSEVVQNHTYANLFVSGMTRAEDGMELPLHLSYFAFSPDDLPGVDSILKETRAIAVKLVELKNAPVMDPYSGPVLLSGAAGGVFFHEIFGHRIEGQRMRSDRDGQTFKKMVGQYVLPACMQVYDDPTLRKYEEQDLNGYYKYDEQGVKASRVDVVVDGKIKDFLMTRKPMEGFLKSNGHARAAHAFDPVSRQSNLIIETKDHKTEEELRRLLLEELKAQGKEFGYYFKEVSGGFTLTDKAAINSFNVNPLEVYKIYTDGRPDQLVRGVSLIGTPLAMFSNIIHAGGQPEIFTGTCGAESGPVPVSAISPSLLVKKVEVQRVPKSPKEHPILKRP